MNPKNEPVAWGGAITALATAGIPLLRAFGVTITADQSNAILAFLAAAIVFGSLAVRSRVTPVAKAEEAIHEAYFSDPAKDAIPTLAKTRVA